MRIIITTLLLSLFISEVQSQEYLLESPDGKIKVELIVSANTVYRVFYGSKLIMHGKPIGLTIGKKNKLGYNEFEPKVTENSVNRTVNPIVPYRSSEIQENYNELSLSFKSGLDIDFRCYDDGFAYRLNTSFERETTINEESMGFELTTNPNVWYPKEKGFFSSNEKKYLATSSQELKKGEMASLPVLWHWENGPFLLYTETDLHDYPEMYIKTDGDGGYEAKFPKVPSTFFNVYDRFEMVGFTKPYIAKTNGTRSYPWRVFTVVKDEKELINSQLPWLLASETEMTDTDWIKPGKVAWDWWNALNLQGVDFKPGLTTETYKYYIDFAAENGIEYIVMDEGWYKLGNLLQVKKEIDMEELIRYGKSKNVDIILWVVWRTLRNQFDEAFTQFSDWGIAGIKMDFMNRHDQTMVSFYEQVAKECADRKMLVDFHGCHSPKGLQRTYPNVLTYEGVLGLEQVKWSKWVTPDHDVVLPFTRMLAGPMDYTPGAMSNASSKKAHQIRFKSPESIGTRCHELAKYVIFESPLQMLADAPTAYQKEKECMKFLSMVPTVWDETVVLDATVGEHIFLARRKDDVWYLGGMTGSLAQTISIDFSFLNEGQYKMDVWRDGENTRTDGTSYEYFTEENIDPSMKYIVSMAEGGGWVAIITKK